MRPDAATRFADTEARSYHKAVEMNSCRLATGTIILAVLVYSSVFAQHPQSIIDHSAVRSAPPFFLSATFTFSPANPVVRETIAFTGQAVGVPPFTFAWDMGDGTTNSSQQIIYHAYSQPGVFQVTMAVIDGLNETASSAQAVTVSNPQSQQMTADFSISPSSPSIGDMVTFTAQASGGSPGGYLYSWDIAGVASSGQTATYVFNQPGAYAVTLTVVDTLGETVTVGHQVNIVQPAPSPPPFTMTIASSSENPQTLENVTLGVSITGGTPPYVVQWEFGDNHTGQGITVIHSYIAQGKYTVLVNATDSTGATVSANKQLSVSGPKPKSPGVYPGLSNEELAVLIIACTSVAFGYTAFSMRAFRRQQLRRRQGALNTLSPSFTGVSEREGKR